MKNILLIGAGRSSTALINYLLDNAKNEKWYITVADANLELALSKVKGHALGRAIWLNVQNSNDRKEVIARADLIITLLPAHLHLEVARDCIRYNKKLITSSYVSKEMYRLGDEARDASLGFVGEKGLATSIEMITSIQKINEIRAKGGKILSYRSYSGGLVEEQSLKDNPWKFKFTWNPRNTVLEGQGSALYLRDGRKRIINYNRLFGKTSTIQINGFGKLEGYVNRDSLLFNDIYGLDDIPTIRKYTLRYKGFSKAWQALIKLGLTDGHYPILGCETMTWHELLNALVPKGNGSVKERTADFLKISLTSSTFKRLEWLGIFRKVKIGIADATPALILEHLLLKKFKLEEGDKDIVILYLDFNYELEGKQYKLTSKMVVRMNEKGETAMSQFIGLPMGILTKMVLNDEVNGEGIKVPTEEKVYIPLLKQLETFGIQTEDQITEITKK